MPKVLSWPFTEKCPDPHAESQRAGEAGLLRCGDWGVFSQPTFLWGALNRPDVTPRLLLTSVFLGSYPGPSSPLLRLLRGHATPLLINQPLSP